jgi:hypothetical protein
MEAVRGFAAVAPAPGVFVFGDDSAYPGLRSPAFRCRAYGGSLGQVRFGSSPDVPNVSHCIPICKALKCKSFINRTVL